MPVGMQSVVRIAGDQPTLLAPYGALDVAMSTSGGSENTETRRIT